MSDYTPLYNRSRRLKDHQSDSWMNVHSKLHDEAARINHKIGYKGPDWHGHEHHERAVQNAKRDLEHGHKWGLKSYAGSAALAGALAINPNKVKATSKRGMIAAGLTAGGLALHDVAMKIRRKRKLAEAERVDTAFKHESGQ